MSIYHAPWLARDISVVESHDPTLVGVTGMVVEETRRTLRVRTSSGEVVIDGSVVTQRPEDRINRRYRRN